MKLVKRCNSYLPERNDFFNQIMGKDFFMEPQHFFGQSNQPRVNIKQTDNEYNIELAAPGFEKEDFKLELENNILSISIENTNENNESNDSYTHFEFQNQAFKRSFTLPKGKTKEEEISASYKNGILSINIPKTEEAKPKPKRVLSIA